MSPKRLRDLIDQERVVRHRGDLDLPISGVATDSRIAKDGDLFVCLPGYTAPGGETLADRHAFAAAAMARGAAAFVVQRDVDVGDRPVVHVDDTWIAAASAAARFHEHPSSSMRVVGVTGTSGKTSTSYFIDAVLQAAGHRVARLGTIDYRIGERTLVAEQTTPEAPVLQGLIRSALDAGCDAVAMEVSSHALELQRAAEIAFDVGVFTNLSRDHLNFHPDMDSYAAAKARLFESLGSDGVAVVNLDDEYSARMTEGSRARVLSFATSADADVVATDVTARMDGLAFRVRVEGRTVPVELPHAGDYNVHNALAAFATGVALEMEPESIAAALSRAEMVPGRFELVDGGQDFAVVVDYAHKPVALERLLEGARRLKPRRLITVVGCGGDRDRGKRPVMGKIASVASDLVVVTSDNPRTEDPAAIVEDVVAGCREHDPDLDGVVVEVDRSRAIRLAVERAGPGDMVVIAGKGHEPYQLIGGETLDFDDREHARAAIAARR